MTDVPNIVITMAGRGSRFQAAGYTQPKYAVEVHGRTLFEWSMLSLRNFIQQGCPFTFVALREHRAEAFIRASGQTLGIKHVELTQIEDVTDGQATTVLAAAATLPPDAPLLIYNIDTFVHPDALPTHDFRGDGWIPCFPGEGEGWSFARTNAENRVQEVREKQRISPYASVGLYGFSSVALYQQAYNAYYADEHNIERGEKYVAPLYNQLLASGLPVIASILPPEAVHPLGTPAEVERFASQAIAFDV